MIPQPAVSIVMPIYNCQNHLSEALDSLIAQTFTEYEVICVDDGSNDESAIIIERYVKIDPRVRYVKQSNQGAGIARNTGMDQARGEWLLFLDSDDVFEPQLIEALHSTAISQHADVAVCFAFDFHGTLDSRKTRLVDSRVKKAFSGRETICLGDLGERAYTTFTLVPWDKMFRADFVKSNSLRFMGLKTANDSFFVLSALQRAERIALVEKPLVNYRMGQSGNLQTMKVKSPTDIFESLFAFYDANSDLMNEEQSRGFIRLCGYQYVQNYLSLPDAHARRRLYNFFTDSLERIEPGILGRPDLLTRNVFYTPLTRELLRPPEMVESRNRRLVEKLDDGHFSAIDKVYLSLRSLRYGP